MDQVTEFSLTFPTGLKNPPQGPYSYFYPKIEFKDSEGFLMNISGNYNTFRKVDCKNNCKTC